MITASDVREHEDPPSKPRTPKSVIGTWFVRQGVPHFVQHYSARNRAPTMDLLLLMVLSFEMCVAPVMPAYMDSLFSDDFTLQQLVLTPGAIMLLGVLLRPLFRWLPDFRPRQRIRPASVVVWLTTVTVVGLLLYNSRLPWFWEQPWVRFLTCLLGLLAARQLLTLPRRPGKWYCGWRRGLPGVMAAVSIVLFDLSGSLGWSQWMSNQIAVFLEVSDGGSFSTRILQSVVSLPGLVVVSCILISTQRISTANAGVPVVWRAPEASGRDDRSPLAAFLVLLFVVDRVIPQGVFPSNWWAVKWMLLGLALFLWRASPPDALQRFAEGVSQRFPWLSAGSSPGVLLWLTLYLLAFPCIVGLYFDIDVEGRAISGLSAFLITLGVNAAYFLVALLIVGYGIDEMALWAARWFRRDLKGVAKALVKALPLLLLFATFFLLTAETWQVLHLAGDTAYLVLICSLIICVAGVVLLASHQHVGRDCHFENWGGVRELVKSAEASDDRDDPETKAAFDLLLKGLEAEPPHAPVVTLRGAKKANAAAFFLVHQMLTLVPVWAATTLVFYGIARLTVSDAIAAEWIYGDAATREQRSAVTSGPFIDEPWPRVALVLALFSILYLAVTVVSNEEQRKDFLGGADEALRQRIAVRLAYEEVFLGCCFTPGTHAHAFDGAVSDGDGIHGRS